MSIDAYNETITHREIESRIEEITDDLGFEVYRTRNSEVIETFSSEDSAIEYIDAEDYDPLRVLVRPQQPDEDDARELSQLRQLDEEVDGNFSSWVRDGQPLYRDDYFDEEWAKERVSVYQSAYLDLDDYPFNYLDWDDVARTERDNNYTRFEFDGRDYYIEDE